MRSAEDARALGVDLFMCGVAFIDEYGRRVNPNDVREVDGRLTGPDGRVWKPMDTDRARIPRIT